MKFAPVLPVGLYWQMDLGSYHMVQVHLIETDKQRALFAGWSKRSDHLVIMDNGMIELGEAAAGTLLSTAALIKPDEIICPDAANDKDKTIELCRTYVHECATCCKRVMLVPQGRDVVEWCHCCREMLSMTMTSTSVMPVSIGVTKLISQYPGGRFAALAWLYNHIDTYGFEGIYENVHLLGLDIGVQEYMYLQAYFPQLRGCDSTWPYAAARQGEYVHFSSVKPEMKEEYWHDGTAFGEDEEVICRTRINIAMMKAFLGTKPAVMHAP
jgi:hypothetical protein